ncbi:MAG: hypothetical protein AAFU61_17890, partial [Pseudomonadota bacterium]
VRGAAVEDVVAAGAVDPVDVHEGVGIGERIDRRARHLLALARCDVDGHADGCVEVEAQDVEGVAALERIVAAAAAEDGGLTLVQPGHVAVVAGAALEAERVADLVDVLQLVLAVGAMIYNFMDKGKKKKKDPPTVEQRDVEMAAVKELKPLIDDGAPAQDDDEDDEFGDQPTDDAVAKPAAVDTR